jgi:hypothetical protein
VLLVHLGTPEEGETFFKSRWPEARAVSDEDEELYRAFGLGQGTASQLFGPRVFLAGLKAARHGVGMPVGNPLRMSGWFLLDRGAVVWSHVHEHAGATRRYEELARAYRALGASSA